MVARRDLVVGQARGAQCLQHLFHHQPGARAARPVPPPDRGELRLLPEGLPQTQGHGGEALLPVALGPVAVHGGQQDPVGDRAQQFGLVAEVPVEAGGVGPQRRGELAHAERLGVAREQQLRRGVQDLLGRPAPSACHLVVLPVAINLHRAAPGRPSPEAPAGRLSLVHAPAAARAVRTASSSAPPRRQPPPRAARHAGAGAGESTGGRRPPRAKKAARGRIAAPTVTASGPRRPSAMPTRPAGCLRAWASVWARTDSRKAGPSWSPAQPPTRTRSGWKRLTRSASPAPRYSAVSARTSAATGSGSPPSPGRAADSRAVSAASSSAPDGGCPPASRHRASSASAPAYASRQPRAPHRQRRPRTRTVRCPHSTARPCSTSSVTTHAPTPEPKSTTTALRAPRPPPNHISACPSVLAPFSTNSGTCAGSRPESRSSASSGTASQPTVWPCTRVPSAVCSTIPGTPMPTPSSSPRPCARPSARSAPSTSATPSRMCPATTPTS